MADGNLIETLKRIIRKQTVRIGSVVTNLHQGVAAESPPLSAGAKQQWLWSRVPGGWLMSLQEFYAAYTADGGYKTDIIDGREGAAVVSSQTAQVHFLRGTVRTPVGRSIEMAVSTNSARGEWSVYVDNTLQRKGVDSGRFTLTIDEGVHAIEIIAYSESLGVLVPRDLEISALLESLRKPLWKSLTTGYVDAFMANPANRLEWFTDPRCGGWRVMRRETDVLGPIAEASGVGVKGQIGIIISGDYQANLELGEELTAGTETMGTVLGFTYTPEPGPNDAVPEGDGLLTGWASSGDWTEVDSSGDFSGAWGGTDSMQFAASLLFGVWGDPGDTVRNTKQVRVLTGFVPGQPVGIRCNCIWTLGVGGPPGGPVTFIGMDVNGVRASPTSPTFFTPITWLLSVDTVADANGEVTVSFVIEGMAGSFDIIVAFSDLLVSDPQANGQTMVRLRLDPSVSGPSVNWIGRFVGSGKWNELARVRRSSVTGTVKYSDTAVRVGNIYEYKLQSFGLADETQVSPWSEIEYVRAGDVDPPGNITFLPGYPALTEPRRVTAKFFTPEDEDYAGVRVYYRQTAYSGTVLSASGDWVVPAGGGSFTPNAYVGYTLQIPSGGSIEDDLFQVVTSNSSLTFYTSGSLFQVPEAGDRLVIFYDKPILTDYGSPDQEDQVSFEPVFVGTRLGSGDYHFRTFDYTGNEQLFSGVIWNATTGGPNPIFGTLLGESTLFQGFDPRFPTLPVGGCVWLPVVVDRNTAEVWAFAEQSATTPVAISELSNNTQAWTLKRQEGDLPNAEDWSTMLYIATKTNYYQRVYAFGVGYNGQRGRTFTAEVQAVDTHTPTLPTVEDLTSSIGVDAIDLSWTVPGTTASEFPIETIVLRNGYPLARLLHPSGTIYPYDQTLSDSGIASDVDYDYEVFTWSEGISGGLGITNAPRQPTVGEIFLAFHIDLTSGSGSGFEFPDNYWAVYYRNMPAGVGSVVLYYSFDGVNFFAGPSGDGSEPFNDGADDYGILRHQETSNFRRYYKILVYDGDGNALGWTNTYQTDGTSGAATPVTLSSVVYEFTDRVSPPDYAWTLYYDTTSLDPRVAYLQGYFSFGGDFGTINPPEPVDFSVPYLIDGDTNDTPRYYKVRAFDADMVELGWSNVVYLFPVVPGEGGGGGGGACNIITSTSTVATSSFSKPGYLVAATEPDFDTDVIRLTGNPGASVPTVGGTWPNLIYHYYAKVQPWSSDMGLIALSQTSGEWGPGATLFLDGSTYAPLFTRSGPGGGGEWRWHPTTADTAIYLNANATIGHWNVVSNTSTPQFSVSGYSGAEMGPDEGNPSYDGRYLAVKAVRTSDSKLVAFAVDIQTATKYADIDLAAQGVSSVDWISISPLGNYVVCYGTISGGSQRTKVWDKSGTVVGTWTDHPFGHYDLGVDQQGNEVAFGSVSSGSYSHHFIMRRLSNAAITSLSGAWTSFNWHASCRNYGRTGWGYASINDTSGYLLDGEVVAIKLDAVNQVERIGRHRTNNIDYDSAAFAVPSPDGKRVMFASNWGDGSGRPVQTYVIDVRGICP